MSERDCQHGRQTGKCSDCDIETLELENRMMRERNERLEQELAIAQEERRIAIKAYRELLLKYDRLEEKAQK